MVYLIVLFVSFVTAIENKEELYETLMNATLFHDCEVNEKRVDYAEVDHLKKIGFSASCDVKVSEDEIYESKLYCYDNEIRSYFMETIDPEFNMTFSNFREKCNLRADITMANVVLNSKHYDLGDKGELQCLHSDKKLSFECKTGGIHINGVKADEKLIMFLCRTGCEIKEFNELKKDVFKQPPEGLLDKVKGFPNNKFFCALFVYKLKEFIECSEGKLYVGPNKTPIEKVKKNYYRCNSYCILPEFDLPRGYVPKIPGNILEHRQIHSISCNYGKNIVIECNQEKIYFYLTEVAFDVDFVFGFCDALASVNYIEFTFKRKFIINNEFKVFPREKNALKQKTDLRCKIVQNGKTKISTIFQSIKKFWAVDDNGKLRHIIDFDDVIDCTRECGLVKLPKGMPGKIDLERNQKMFRDKLTLTCTGRNGSKLQKTYFCIGEQLCEGEFDDLESCTQIELLCLHEKEMTKSNELYFLY